METEVYLYSGIYDWQAERTSRELSAAASNGTRPKMRVNCQGGNVFAGYGIITKMVELGENGTPVDIIVDGVAMSMGAAFLPFAGKVVAVDTALIMLHRIAGGSDSEEDKALLAQMNEKFRGKLELKLNMEAFEKVTGYTLKQIFEDEKRIDVFLNAVQAKKVGLVDEIKKLSKEEYSANAKNVLKFAASYDVEEVIDTKKIDKKMDIIELKAKHPELYKAAFDEGVVAEADRVNACLVFLEVDPKGTKEAIASGKPLTATQMAEFSLKVMAKASVKNIADGNAEEITTDEPKGEQTAKELEVEAFKKDVLGNLNKN